MKHFMYTFQVQDFPSTPLQPSPPPAGPNDATGLGTYQGETFKIEVDPTVASKFCKARSVPYAMRGQASKEIDRLISEGICEPVAHSPWACGLVPVLKKDGSLRLCGD